MYVQPDGQVYVTPPELLLLDEEEDEDDDEVEYDDVSFGSTHVSLLRSHFFCVLHTVDAAQWEASVGRQYL